REDDLLIDPDAVRWALDAIQGDDLNGDKVRVDDAYFSQGAEWIRSKREESNEEAPASSDRIRLTNQSGPGTSAEFRIFAAMPMPESAALAAASNINSIGSTSLGLDLCAWMGAPSAIEILKESGAGSHLSELLKHPPRTNDFMGQKKP